jgi:hypothetical protein
LVYLRTGSPRSVACSSRCTRLEPVVVVPIKGHILRGAQTAGAVLAAWMGTLAYTAGNVSSGQLARAAFTAGYAAGNLSSGQLVPVLLKAARSGSTWVGSILQEVSHRPFYLEARGPPAALQMELVLSGVGFSTNPVGTNATRHDWAAFGRAVVGRAALVVLHRANVAKHAISFLRVEQAHSECGGVKSAGCMALQPSAINMWQLQEVLQCVYLHDHVLDTLFEQVTATGVPGLALTYEVNTALPDTRTRTRIPGLLRMHTVHRVHVPSRSSRPILSALRPDSRGCSEYHRVRVDLRRRGASASSRARPGPTTRRPRRALTTCRACSPTLRRWPSGYGIEAAAWSSSFGPSHTRRRPAPTRGSERSTRRDVQTQCSVLRIVRVGVKVSTCQKMPEAAATQKTSGVFP